MIWIGPESGYIQQYLVRNIINWIERNISYKRFRPHRLLWRCILPQCYCHHKREWNIWVFMVCQGFHTLKRATSFLDVCEILGHLASAFLGPRFAAVILFTGSISISVFYLIVLKSYLFMFRLFFRNGIYFRQSIGYKSLDDLNEWASPAHVTINEYMTWYVLSRAINSVIDYSFLIRQGISLWTITDNLQNADGHDENDEDSWISESTKENIFCCVMYIVAHAAVVRSKSVFRSKTGFNYLSACNQTFKAYILR